MAFDILRRMYRRLFGSENPNAPRSGTRSERLPSSGAMGRRAHAATAQQLRPPHQFGATRAPASATTDDILGRPRSVVPVDWQQGNSGNLVGSVDAFEQTPLLPGEQVARCAHDKVAYHLSTW